MAWLLPSNISLERCESHIAACGASTPQEIPKFPFKLILQQLTPGLLLILDSLSSVHCFITYINGDFYMVFGCFSVVILSGNLGNLHAFNFLINQDYCTKTVKTPRLIYYY